MENQNKPDSTQQRSTRPYKRRARNILIHKPMQREFTFVMIALLMLSTLAIGFVIHETIREAAFGGGFHFGKINPYEVLSEVSYQLIIRVSAILFLTLVVIGIFGVFFLHRVAGPVFRFRQAFLRLNDGEMPRPVKLREGDFFMETATEVNRLLKKVEAERGRREKALQKLNEALGKGGASEATLEGVREAKALLEESS